METIKNPGNTTLVLAVFILIFYILLSVGAFATYGAVVITSSALTSWIYGIAVANTGLTVLVGLAMLWLLQQKKYPEIRTGIPTTPFAVGSCLLTLLLFLANGFMVQAGFYAVSYFVMYFVRFNLVPKV